MKEQTDRYRYIFQELLEMTEDGFIVVDPQGRITDINEKYSQFLNTSKQEAIGRPIHDFISHTRMPQIMSEEGPDKEESVMIQFEKGETKEGEDRFALVSRAAVYNSEGKVIAGIAQIKFRLQTLDSAKKMMREYQELEFYKETFSALQGKDSLNDILGKGKRMMELKKAAKKAAKMDFPVLLTGETGTGKEVFARAIHQESPRKVKPLVSVNCAAIPSELLESELFGYEEGAFTGAKKGGKMGKFQLADGGTLFLDEIGDMPLAMQAKLLRVLQEKEIERVGGLKPVAVDVRILAATRRNLPEMVREGLFREDLFYRLNVITLELPPLRERPEDIVDLAALFLSRLNKEYKTSILFSQEVLRCFARYRWPGNIRELDNVVKSAYASCDGLMIESEDLPAKVASGFAAQRVKEEKKLSQMMEEYERNLLIDALNQQGGNCQAAARQLGIHRSALYKKINRLGIQLKREAQ